MKTSINQDNRQGKFNRHPQEGLSVKDALTWFIITVIALCIAGRSEAKGRFGSYDLTLAPVAYDITMTPVVQSTSILPFKAVSVGSNISAYTIHSVPAESQGVLSLSMDGLLIPVSEGMMVTPDLAASFVFTPDSSFNGEVLFTYSANDEEGITSNIANYIIPVIGKQQVILPISLLNFSGTENNRKVQLHWQTENEANSSYFEIQRSADGNGFETIATVTALGNVKNNYQSTDDLFFYVFKTVYYRIKMVNINGSFKYSSSVMLQLGAAGKSSIKAWPVPFNSNLNISFEGEEKETVKITIRSINGSEVMNFTSTVTKGSNTIALYQAQSMPAGTYLLTVSSRTKAETIKVIKQ
jgi:Secretion system C-terminal sorting domain